MSDNDEMRSAKLHARYILKHFDLLPEQYEYAIKTQNGLCKICEKPAPTGQKLAVFAIAGKPKGLVCRRCKMGVEYFYNDVALLRRAAFYIESFAEAAAPIDNPPTQ